MRSVIPGSTQVTMRIESQIRLTCLHVADELEQSLDGVVAHVGLMHQLSELEVATGLEWSPWLVEIGREVGLRTLLTVLFERVHSSFVHRLRMILDSNIIKVWRWLLVNCCGRRRRRGSIWLG